MSSTLRSVMKSPGAVQPTPCRTRPSLDLTGDFVFNETPHYSIGGVGGSPKRRDSRGGRSSLESSGYSPGSGVSTSSRPNSARFVSYKEFRGSSLHSVPQRFVLRSTHRTQRAYTSWVLFPPVHSDDEMVNQRLKVMAWLFNIEKVLPKNSPLSKRTPFIASFIIDRYIEKRLRSNGSSDSDTPLHTMASIKKGLELLGLTALFLASKIEDVWPLVLDDVLKVTPGDNPLQRGHVLSFEKNVLETLDFDVGSSIFDHIDPLLVELLPSYEGTKRKQLIEGLHLMAELATLHSMSTLCDRKLLASCIVDITESMVLGKPNNKCITAVQPDTSNSPCHTPVNRRTDSNETRIYRFLICLLTSTLSPNPTRSSRSPLLIALHKRSDISKLFMSKWIKTTSGMRLAHLKDLLYKYNQLTEN